MKKISNYLLLSLLAVFSLSLTSCDRDHNIAFELDGTWDGYINANGRSYTTTWVFRQDGFSRHGYGYEYAGRWSDYTEFDWTVDNGNIYLYYKDYDRTEVVLHDYRLTSSRLEGYIQDAYYGNDRAFCSFSKTSNGYGSYSSWRYAPKQQNVIEDDEKADSAK